MNCTNFIKSLRSHSRIVDYFCKVVRIFEQKMVLTESAASNSAYCTTMPFTPASSSAGDNTGITSTLGGYQGPSDILRLMWRANNFLMQGLRCQDGSTCLPLIVGCRQIGVLKRQVVEILSRYPDVFSVNHDAVVMNPQLSTYESRTAAMSNVLMDIRLKRETNALKSWRNENFAVWGHYGTEPLMEVERAAVALLGIRSYGIHITGYVRGQDGQVAGVWLQKRADNKPTYPGMLDNMVGGGITAGLTASQVLLKEAAEEASIPPDLIAATKAVGTVSFFTETERGLHANTEHIYDLELPSDFVPQNSDGEVQDFKYVPIKNIVGILLDPNYKLTSTPILTSFLIRHGILNSDSMPDYPEVVEMLHISLNLHYRMWPSFNLNQNKYYQSTPSNPLHTMSALSLSPSAPQLVSRLESVPDSDMSSVITESSQSERNYDSDLKPESEDGIYY